MPGLVQPGLPQTSGGNDPIRAAAQSNLGGGALAGATDPSQLPQGGGQAQAGQGMTVAEALAIAFQLFIQGGAQPQDVAAIEQFLGSLQQVASATTQGAPAGQAPPGPVQGVQATAPAGPQFTG